VIARAPVSATSAELRIACQLVAVIGVPASKQK
jgi:hypothetical protein